MVSDPDVVDRDRVDEEDGAEDEPSFFADPKRLAQTGIVVLLLAGNLLAAGPGAVAARTPPAAVLRAE